MPDDEWNTIERTGQGSVHRMWGGLENCKYRETHFVQGHTHSHTGRIQIDGILFLTAHTEVRVVYVLC